MHNIRGTKSEKLSNNMRMVVEKSDKHYNKL